MAPNSQVETGCQMIGEFVDDALPGVPGPSFASVKEKWVDAIKRYTVQEQDRLRVAAGTRVIITFGNLNGKCEKDGVELDIRSEDCLILLDAPQSANGDEAMSTRIPWSEIQSLAFLR